MVFEILTLLTVTGSCATSLYQRYHRDTPEAYVSRHRTLLPGSADLVRIARRFSWPQERAPTAGHPHGMAAAQRLQAVALLNTVCSTLGLTRFDVSLAERDGDMAGMREIHDMSDLSKPFVARPVVEGNAMVTFVDTIEHMSLPEIGAITKGGPFAAYMSSPRHAAGIVPDGRYCWVDSEIFRWEVFGGRVYEHGTYTIPDQFVLEFNPDLPWRGRAGICSPRAWLFPRIRTTLYQSVSYRQPGNADKIVFLAVPLATFDRSARVICARLARLGRSIQFSFLNRMRVDVVGETIVRGSLEGEQSDVSIAWKGDVTGNVVYVPSPAWAALRHAALDVKSFQHSDVERMLTSINKDRKYNQAALRLVTAAVQSKAGPRYHVNYTVVGGCAGLVEAELGRPVAVLAGPCLVAPACAASACENNRVASGRLRLKDLLNKQSMSFEMRQFADEFVREMVPIPGAGVPRDLQEIFAVQNSAAQRARQRQAAGKVSHVNKASAFQKAEAGEAVVPRNIVSLSQGPNQRLAQFVYAFKQDILQFLHWFYPGAKPAEISARLERWLRTLPESEDGGVTHGEGDFSKLDARVSKDIREYVLHASLLRWVSAEYHDELFGLLEDEVDLRVYFAGQLIVKPDGAILSGSSDTSIFGTEANAFVQYVALRRAYPDFTPKEIMERLGVCFGDDSVVRHGPDYASAARDLGMELKYSRSVKQGRFSFLARHFAPLETVGSVPHIIRRLSKLPVVTSKAPGAHKFKVLGHLAVDGDIPVLSEYLGALARIGGYGKAKPSKELYDGKGDICWMVQQGPYPVDGAFEAFAIECVCDELCLSSSDVARLRYELDMCDSAEQLDELALEHLGLQPAAKLPVVRH